MDPFKRKRQWDERLLELIYSSLLLANVVTLCVLTALTLGAAS